MHTSIKWTVRALKYLQVIGANAECSGKSFIISNLKLAINSCHREGYLLYHSHAITFAKLQQTLFQENSCDGQFAFTSKLWLYFQKTKYSTFKALCVSTPLLK